MLDAYGIVDSIRLFIFLMIGFAFFVGILLLVSQEAFDAFNKDLQKEYGLKKRLFPLIEDSKFDFIDFLLLRYRFLAGLLISVVAFILLLLYKV